jgi:hypothetical protein
MPDFLTTKLNEIGLNAATLKPQDLVIPQGKSYVISPKDPKMPNVTWIDKGGVTVKPRSFKELKLMIGIPDKAVGNLPRRHIPVSRIASPEVLRTHGAPRLELTRSALEIAKGYLYSDSKMFAHYLPYLEEFFGKYEIFIPVFRNITIEKDAVLIINSSVKSLYANNIIIKSGGLLKSKSDTLHIVCDSLQGNL